VRNIERLNEFALEISPEIVSKRRSHCISYPKKSRKVMTRTKHVIPMKLAMKPIEPSTTKKNLKGVSLRVYGRPTPAIRPVRIATQIAGPSPRRSAPVTKTNNRLMRNGVMLLDGDEILRRCGNNDQLLSVKSRGLPAWIDKSE
jgi:hypothetical protein